MSATCSTSCFNTQPRGGGCPVGGSSLIHGVVSTHSRAEATAYRQYVPPRHARRFNTQPPEGGCNDRRCEEYNTERVSTHSRPKAAANRFSQLLFILALFQHTAARRRLLPPQQQLTRKHYGFNTQPPEGGCIYKPIWQVASDCFNTQPPEGGCLRLNYRSPPHPMFQHTAARRRLRERTATTVEPPAVSTHSRPKAAAFRRDWDVVRESEFQHTAARRRLQRERGQKRKS